MQKTAQAKALLSILTSLKCNEISCYNKLSVENFNCVIFDSDVYLFCAQIWKFMCIMHQRAWYVHRCIILDDRSLTLKTQSVWVLMTRDAYSQMYNVAYTVHVYQISDENDFIKILSARRGHICKHWILSGCFEKQSLVFVF